jgi:hypothetical protein
VGQAQVGNAYVVGISTGSALSSSTFIKNSVAAGGAGGFTALSSQLPGNVNQFGVNPVAGARGRITWREILP